METTITLNLDSAVAQWLNETPTETTPEELASTILTAHLVDEGAPVPSRYGVGREDFLRAADCALDDFSPLEPFVEGRRKRVARGGGGVWRELLTVAVCFQLLENIRFQIRLFGG